MDAQITRRRALPVINAAYSPLLFADGRVGGSFVDPITGDTLMHEGAALESQTLVPILSPVEMSSGGARWSTVTERLKRSAPLALAADIPAGLRTWIGDRDYPALFREVFGTPAITPPRIAMAIASYERTLVADRTPYDSVLAGLATLRPEEALGRSLFDSLGCSNCHTGPLLTDNKFHVIGVEGGAPDSGRALVTHRAEDVGAFRTPSLRNVALRKVFMHGGQARSLSQIMTFYYGAGDDPLSNVSPLLKSVFFTGVESKAVIAFLTRPLTDPRIEREEPPFDRPRLFSESSLAPEVMHEAACVEGAAGTAPQPYAIEPAILGNPDFTVAVYAALGGAPATLVIDQHDPGTTLPRRSATEFLRRTVSLAGTGPSGGYASVDLQIPNRRELLGAVFYARWYVLDPGAAGGVAVSPTIRIRLFGRHGEGAAAPLDPNSRPPRLHPVRNSPDGTVQLLRYDLFSDEAAQLWVEDSTGARLKRLASPRALGPGSYYAFWDGRDSTEGPVARGRYFVRISTPTSSRRMPIVGGW